MADRVAAPAEAFSPFPSTWPAQGAPLLAGWSVDCAWAPPGHALVWWVALPDGVATTEVQQLAWTVARHVYPNPTGRLDVEGLRLADGRAVAWVRRRDDPDADDLLAVCVPTDPRRFPFPTGWPKGPPARPVAGWCITTAWAPDRADFEAATAATMRLASPEPDVDDATVSRLAGAALAAARVPEGVRHDWRGVALDGGRVLFGVGPAGDPAAPVLVAWCVKEGRDGQ